MDPDAEEDCKSLLKEWQKQDDDSRDRLESIDEKTGKTHELLRDLKDHVVSLDFTKPFGMEKSKSLDFITYFTIVQTKPCAALVSQYYPHPFLIEQRQKNDDHAPKPFFWTSKQPYAINFFLASCNVCPVAIPEIFA